MIKNVIFDCDSTITQVEGIDLLADKNNVWEEVSAITRRSMEHSSLTIDIFEERLDLVQPTLEQVQDLGGIYHTHVRYRLGDRFLDPFREAIEIGEKSGVPVHVTHFYQRSPSTGGGNRLIGLLEDAVEGGQDVTFDSYPYVLGSTRILIVFPDCAHNRTLGV